MDAIRPQPLQKSLLAEDDTLQSAIIGNHCDHDTTWLGHFIWFENLLCPLRNQRFCSSWIPVVRTEFKASFQEIKGHRLAHVSQPNETDTFAHNFPLHCCPAYSRIQVRIVLATTPSAAAIASCMRSSKSCPFLPGSGSNPTCTPQRAIALRKAVRTSVLIFSLAIPMRIAF